jgi:S-adenosylhomocysteine hydrolase
MTIQTAVLIETLVKNLGAEVRWSSHVTSSRHKITLLLLSLLLVLEYLPEKVQTQEEADLMYRTDIILPTS